MPVLGRNQLDVFGQVTDSENAAVAGIPCQQNGNTEAFGYITVQGKEPGAVPGQMNAAFHDIGGQFGRRPFQHPADRLDDGAAGVPDGLVGLG